MLVFYFTATGNSLAVAKRIGGDLSSIPQVINSPNLEYKDDVIGVVFPIYSLEPAKLVGQWLDNVKLEADYTFAVGTYGNDPGAAMLNLQKRAKEQGYRFDYAAHLLMVDNFLPNFEIGDEIARLPIKKTEAMTSQVVEDIRNRKHSQATASWGARALTATLRLFDPLVYTGKQGQGYLINDNCTQCGVCAKVCPAGNITVADKVRFSNQCMGCLACAHHCPQNAIHVKGEKSAKRWRNPEVSLKEIIGANNQGQSRL